MGIARLFRAAFVVITILIATSNPARADSAPEYVVTYIEADHFSAAKMVSLLRRWVHDVSHTSGNLGIVALQNRSLKNQFAIVEIWSDEAAFQSHAASPETKAYHDALAPLLLAPYDERPHAALAADPARLQAVIKSAPPKAVFIVTHVDVVSAKKEEGVVATIGIAGNSRTERGNLAFDVLSQANRPNHMSVFEVWTSEASFEAHQRQDFIKSYRASLLPMSGALYDQRFYSRVE